MQNSIRQLADKIQNLIIWELIRNWKLPTLSEVEGKIENSAEMGYVAISIILILTAVVLGIIVTVAQLGIGEGQVSLALSKGEDTLHFVEGCTEDALLKIRSSPSYTGGTISRPEGTCLVTVTGGGPYTVTASVNNWQGTSGYNRTIQVVVTRGSTMSLTSWKEL